MSTKTFQKKMTFLEAYLADPAKNGAEAARRAGWPESKAKQVAWTLLNRDPEVQVELQKKLGVVLSKAEATVEDVVGDVLKLRSEAELVGERYLRLKCDEFLAKFLGMFVEHVEVGLNVEDL